MDRCIDLPYLFGYSVYTQCLLNLLDQLGSHPIVGLNMPKALNGVIGLAKALQ